MRFGILYVSDLFDDGIFKLLEYYLNINDKFNWLCEYKIIMIIMRKIWGLNDFLNLSCVNK